MDIVEFVEGFCGIKLLDYQKELLRKIKDVPPDFKIVYGPKNQIYILDKTKENKTQESPIGFARGLRAKTCIIDDCSFDPSYTIDEHGNMQIRDIALIPKLPPDT